MTKTITKTHQGGTLTEYFDDKGNRIRAVHTTGRLKSVDYADNSNKLDQEKTS